MFALFSWMVSPIVIGPGPAIIIITLLAAHRRLIRTWVLGLLSVLVAGQRQDSGCPAAVTAIVPEPGPDPARQAAVGNGMPASVGKRGPGGVPGDRAEQPENLGVARRAVAPSVAVALDQVGPVLRIGMRDDEVLGSCLVARDDIGGPLQGKLDKIAPPGGRATI